MPEPIDLLLITWNRRAYVEKTLAALREDPADYRLYCWDNASTDGTADLIAAFDDPRVAERRFARENVNQREPCLWFLDAATGDLAGKLDDDVLMPPGWIERLAPVVRADPRAGMLGCWTFMPEDWDESLARRNFVELGETKVFRCVTIGGCAFLARRDLLRRYVAAPHRAPGLPIDRYRLTRDGLVSGYPLPLVLAHHMDDPRSPHCELTRSIDGQASFTARRLGFRSPEEYADWIAADAYARQRYPLATQLRWARLFTRNGRGARLVRRLLVPWAPLRRAQRRIAAERLRASGGAEPATTRGVERAE